jgi:catechol 2,3-dioxygenase-like lactoylglutathione lyase family enzyme
MICSTATNADVHINVSDVPKSTDFYGRLLGARPQHKFTDKIFSIVLPGGEGWISLDGAGADPEQRGRMGHFAVGIERFNADETAAAIKSAFPDLKVETAADKRSCFIRDPDGIRVQLIAREDQGAQ